MFYFVLTISVLHLLWMNLLVYRKVDTSLCMLSAIAPFAIMFCVPSRVLLLQSLAMVALVSMDRWFLPNWRWGYVASSLGVVMAIFAHTTWDAVAAQRDLIERFPMESMAERVPSPNRNISLAPVADRKEWTTLNELLAHDLEENESSFRSRTQNLRRLHEETTENFIRSPGFGVTRGFSGNVQPDRLEFRPEWDSPAPAMGQAETVFFSTEDFQKPYRGNQLDALTQLHFSGLRDFVNVRGFGYIKDRQHVAGFYPHQFSQVPKAESVSVKRLELVGLLIHNQPAVYVSKELPRMKELKKAPTRSMSDFEATGLKSLQKGEDLFVREIESTIHMLGAIRSVEQCMKCHGGERGDLLGAFSYSLAAQ